MVRALCTCIGTCSQGTSTPSHTRPHKTSTHPCTHLRYHHKHQHQHSQEEVQGTQPSQEGEEGGHTGSKPSFNGLYVSVADGQPIPDLSSSLLSPSVELMRHRKCSHYHYHTRASVPTDITIYVRTCIHTCLYSINFLQYSIAH